MCDVSTPWSWERSQLQALLACVETPNAYCLCLNPKPFFRDLDHWPLLQGYEGQYSIYVQPTQPVRRETLWALPEIFRGRFLNAFQVSPGLLRVGLPFGIPQGVHFLPPLSP